MAENKPQAPPAPDYIAALEDIRLGLFDQVAGLRLQWCTAAFARGLQLGLALGVEQGQAPHYRSR